MPKAAKEKKPVQPVAPTPPPPPEPVGANGQATPDLPIVHPTINIVEYSSTSSQGPLTVEDMKEFLGWETEKEFQQRKVTEDPNSKPEHWLYGDVFHCNDVSGAKVRTNRNAHNRPFDQPWCDSLIHSVLQGHWAGPATIPGETVNGETIRISKYGRVLSGQHQMTAGILADEWLEKARKQIGDAANEKYPTWKGVEHVVLETIIITGLSEDPRVLMTIDYCKPRTAADVFYTSEVFKSCTPQERKELCRMLAAAVDLLWVRTEAKGYKTHPEIVGFLDRHPRLMKCVLHIFAENGAAGGRKISKYRISAGQCAAMMYLMGCSGDKTDGDVYRNEMPPTEKQLDWSYWERAEDFWVAFAAAKDFQPVRTALGRLIDSDPSKDDNQGMGGRLPEKVAIISKAWEIYKDHPSSAGDPFTDQDLAPGGVLFLSYSNLDDLGSKMPDGRIKLLDIADFDGIDCPQVIKTDTVKPSEPEEKPPTPEELEKRKQDQLERREIAMKKIEEIRAAKAARK